ncbi:hypothetical protein [Streptomyces sp. NBC_00083]|uniref:hypothetical protein n=1 Tax=Streptomyces sp. NBC_00083 TaxID=2975647 RepID=UPI00224F2055|nr:hypothetical protein [Streptomyces sp. NBC_00083]MCX5382534.1 hypothetical protein [Streptomyces sp. NBC_00083]
MNANVGLTVSVSVADDLVIEEFGRNLSMASAPYSCIGTHIAPAPLAVADVA